MKLAQGIGGAGVFKDFSIFSSGGHFVYWSGTILATLVETHLGNIPVKSESHWLKSFRLVDCFGFNGPLRQYFSLYRAVSQREGEGEEKG